MFKRSKNNFFTVKKNVYKMSYRWIFGQKNNILNTFLNFYGLNVSEQYF